MNTGHGHVHPREDGTIARCGGPAICKECALEAAQVAAATGRLQIVFDGPPGPACGRFVEAERDGRSVKAGKWIERKDGLWALEIDPAAAAPDMLNGLKGVLGALHFPSDVELARARARAAIAQATGEKTGDEG